MHLYKHFWKMLSNNKTGILIYVGIGLITMVIIGFVGPKVINENEENKIVQPSVDISYIDNDNSVLSKGIIEYLSKNNNVNDYAGKSEEEINNLVFFSITEFHLDIPEGFQNDVEQGKDDSIIQYRSNATESSGVFSISNGIGAYVNMYNHYVKAGNTPEEAVQKANDLLTQEMDITVRRNANSLGGTVKEWSIYEMSVYFVYLSLGMILLSAGAVIINSNDEAIGKRIDTAPVKSIVRTIVDTLGLYSFGIVIWIIVIIAMVIYGHDTDLINTRGWLLATMILLSILCNCSFTSFISSFRIEHSALSKIANVVGLSMSFLSGVFVPQWFLGEGVLSVARFVPFYWAVRAANIIYSESGAGIAFNINEIFKCFGMLGIFTVAFAVLAILVRRTRKA